MRYRVLLSLAIAAVFISGCSLLPFGGEQDSSAPPPAPSKMRGSQATTGAAEPTETGTTEPSPSATAPEAAAANAGNGKVVLEYKHKKGETLTYRVRNNIVNNAYVNGKPQRIAMSQIFVFTYKTIALDENGDSTVRITYKSAVANVGGKRVTLPFAGKTVTLIVSPRGQVKSIKSLGGLSSSEGIDYQHLLDDVPAPLPGRPVGIGDTWDSTADIRLPDGSGTLSVTVNYRLAGLRTVRGQRAAVIRSTFTSPVRLNLTQPRFILDMESTGRGSGVDYFSLDTGHMLRSTGTVRTLARQAFHASGLGLPFINSTSRMRVTIVAELVK